MIKVDTCFSPSKGLLSKVELGYIDKDKEVQQVQLELELVAIYDALEKKYSTDEAIELITASITHFLEAHS